MEAIKEGNFFSKSTIMPISCFACPVTLDSNYASRLYAHIVNAHSGDAATNFSCPFLGCDEVITATPKTFFLHFRTHLRWRGSDEDPTHWSEKFSSPEELDLFLQAEAEEDKNFGPIPDWILEEIEE